MFIHIPVCLPYLNAKVKKKPHVPYSTYLRLYLVFVHFSWLLYSNYKQIFLQIFFKNSLVCNYTQHWRIFKYIEHVCFIKSISFVNKRAVMMSYLC